MVPQKNNDKTFDFEKDPIDAYADGGWVTADGTTLGADNGIGVASILAVLEDDTLAHGPLEALFTATEETGMDGAFGLRPGVLQGEILLNLDSEEEGELYVGCAGGLDANTTFRYAEEPTPAAGYVAAKISVRGLKGGHSGIQIVCQRANANKLLFRLLNAAPCPLLLCSVDGGGLRNAIPREAEAVVLVRPRRITTLSPGRLTAYEKAVQGGVSPGSRSTCRSRSGSVRGPAGDAAARRGREGDPARSRGVPTACSACRCSMPGLVQTSGNLARVVSDGSTREAAVPAAQFGGARRRRRWARPSPRSSRWPEAETRADGRPTTAGIPNMESPILKAMTASYEALYGNASPP